MATEIKIKEEMPKKIKFSEVEIGDGFKYGNAYFIKTSIYNQPETTNAMCITKYVKHGTRSREFGELMTFDLRTEVIPQDMCIIIGTVNGFY